LERKGPADAGPSVRGNIAEVVLWGLPQTGQFRARGLVPQRKSPVGRRGWSSLNLSFTARNGTTRATARTMAKSFSARSGIDAFPLSLMDRWAGPPISRGENEIPDENEIQRRCSPAPLLLFGWTCARDGLAHAAGLALTVTRACTPQKTLLPPPALRECCHRSLARCRVAMHRRAILMKRNLPIGGCPRMDKSHRRRGAAPGSVRGPPCRHSFTVRLQPTLI
jgi:hypothetical protein